MLHDLKLGKGIDLKSSQQPTSEPITEPVTETPVATNLPNNSFSAKTRGKSVVVSITGENKTLHQATNMVQKLFSEPKHLSESQLRRHDELIQNAIAGEPNARKQLTSQIIHTLKEQRISVPDMSLSQAAEEIYNYVYGLDVIQRLWDDPEIDEIKVNKPDNVWYIKKGINIKSDITFKDDFHVRKILQKMMLHAGIEFSQKNPRTRVMRKDKSRLTATMPPFSRYHSFALRKLDNFDLTEENYLATGTISPPLLAYIKCLIRARLTTIFSGPTNSGKSTDLMFFLQYLPMSCRIVVLDKTGELFLQDRYPNRDIVELQEVEKLDLSLKEGFDTILSYTPNAIVVPEVRSTEAEEFLKACTRGHDGSLTTGHANSPEELVEAFPNIIMEDGILRNPDVLRRMVARAFKVIIQKTWNPDTGQRRIENITEIYLENDRIVFNDLVRWDDNFNNWRMVNWPTKRLYDKMRFYKVPLEMLKEAGLVQ